MKKIIMATCMTGIFSSLPVFAGSIGPASSALPASTLYAGLEGSYSWNATDTYMINSNSSNNTLKPWGGRLSAGIVRLHSENLRFNAELGGGYYGSSHVNAVGVTSKRSIDGYDFLVGALYRVNKFDVFGNVGVMVENYRNKMTQQLGLVIPGGEFSGTLLTDADQTQALPEIKVGAIYNLNEDCGITLSYMHVFGSNVFGTGTASGTLTNGIAFSGNKYTQAPTLDSILLGLRYYIA